MIETVNAEIKMHSDDPDETVLASVLIDSIPVFLLNKDLTCIFNSHDYDLVVQAFMSVMTQNPALALIARNPINDMLYVEGSDNYIAIKVNGDIITEKPLPEQTLDFVLSLSYKIRSLYCYIVGKEEMAGISVSDLYDVAAIKLFEEQGDI